jgi:hypothetical protein
MRRLRVLERGDIVQLLRIEIDDTGSQLARPSKNGINRAYINQGRHPQPCIHDLDAPHPSARKHVSGFSGCEPGEDQSSMPRVNPHESISASV